MSAQEHNPAACESAGTLIPGYLDGELGESQAGPLRKHLLSCPSCRAKAADLTNIKRWVHAAVPTGEIVVPRGFAARVAQAAFADAGGVSALPAQAKLLPTVHAAVKTKKAVPGGERDGSIQPFVLGLTSVAAVLLLSLSFLLGLQGQPSGSDLAAEQLPDLLPEVLRELDEMNAKRDKDRGSLEIEKERGTYKR